MAVRRGTFLGSDVHPAIVQPGMTAQIEPVGIEPIIGAGIATGGIRPQIGAANIPIDVMDGQPLRCRRLSDTNGLLYPVGLDLQDNSGQPPKQGKAMDQEEGGYALTLWP